MEYTPIDEVAESSAAGDQKKGTRLLPRMSREFWDMLLLDQLPFVCRVIVDATLIKLCPDAVCCNSAEYHVEILRASIDKLHTAGITLAGAGEALAATSRFGRAGTVYEWGAKLAGEVLSCALRNSGEGKFDCVPHNTLQVLEKMFCFCLGLAGLEYANRLPDVAVIEGAYAEQKKAMKAIDREEKRMLRRKNSKRGQEAHGIFKGSILRLKSEVKELF